MPGATAHSDAGSTGSPVPYFGAGDAVFVILAVIVTIMVIKLGYDTFHEGQNTEATKARGEAMVAWFSGHAPAHGGAGGELLAGCDGDGATWSGCRSALTADGGPFAGITNIPHAGGQLFSASCDRTDAGTHGAVMLEKGTPKPPDGASLVYAPLDDDEALDKGPLDLRLSICGRGFSVIRIAEFKF